MPPRNENLHINPMVMSTKVPAAIGEAFDAAALSVIKSRSELLREAILEKLRAMGIRPADAFELDTVMG